MTMDSENLVPAPLYVDEILPEHLPDGLLSIAVFGPGRGEAIVVRLPDGSVGIVDGCREPAKGDADPLGTGDPVRELLNRMKATRLLFACLTHAHSDHYPGLGRLLDAYQKCTEHVWTVTEMGGPFMEALLAIHERKRARKESLPDATKSKGLERAISKLSEAYKLHGSRAKYMQTGLPLFAKNTERGSLQIIACGPAPRDIARLHESLISAVAKSIKKEESVDQEFDLNIASGALLIRWQNAGILLAGDMLCGKNDDSGWKCAHEYIDGPVQVVNVAHHASREAHDETLWLKMSPALAIVTPFMEGATLTLSRNGKSFQKKNPPRPEEVALLATSSIVAITSPPRWEGETNIPKPTFEVTSRTSFGEKNPALPITPSSEIDTSHRNAVAVSLDHTGTIKQFVLAGQARVYDVP